MNYLPLIDVSHDGVGATLSMDMYEVLLHPGYKVVLEGTFD
jgi:hypothetical protein